MKFSRGVYLSIVYDLTIDLLTLTRLAWFYLISAMVGGFSSILAFGLIQMEGLSGVRGWQWIFVSRSAFVPVTSAN